MTRDRSTPSRSQAKLERHILRLTVIRAKAWRKENGKQFPWGHPRCVRPKSNWLLVKLALKLLDTKEGHRG